MSYSVYLRNKAASTPKTIDLHKPTDASQHTTKKRFEATQTFFVDGAFGSLGTPVASTFASYRGGQGIANDSKYLGGGKTEFRIQTCCQVEVPDSEKYVSASDYMRSKRCALSSHQPHNANELGGPLFVDNTIRLSAMVPDMTGDGCCKDSTVAANHTHSPGLPIGAQQQNFAVTQHTFMAAPPGFQNKGVGGARIGAYYNPRSRYVENKHGNDLRVNPRRTPGPWMYTPGAPAHLKINDPKLGNIKP